MAALIEAQHISKLYMLYKRPQDRLKQALLWRLGRSYGMPFWALHDVSFTVDRGETVGIIGRNGSGKSTLLQIIAGTLQPTMGTIQVTGRVAALLELGSGFNPEYTGRENVFLNASILGLTRAETEQYLDEILGFADIGDFVDQPVKLYSSGMMMRLAFAVQAVVPRDILIVDEALAVGDEAFQRKCFARLERFRSEGGTVLLVSHSAQAIIRHCQRCLFLHQGRLRLEGPSRQVTDLYQRFVYSPVDQQNKILAELDAAGPIAGLALTAADTAETVFQSDPSEPAAPIRGAADTFSPELASSRELTYGNGAATIIDPHLEDSAGRRVNVVVAGGTYVWTYLVQFHETAADVNFGMMARSIDGQVLAAINTEFLGHRYERIETQGLARVGFEIQVNLAQGTYFMEAGVVGMTATPAGDGGFLHRRIDVYTFRVLPTEGGPVYGISYFHPRASMALEQPADPNVVG